MTDKSVYEVCREKTWHLDYTVFIGRLPDFGEMR